jgi:modification methylase
MMTETQSFGTSRRESHSAKKFYARGLATADEDRTSVPKAPSKESIDKIFCSSSESMTEVEDDSVSLMVTSPPYHVGKEYDSDDPFDEYLGLLHRAFGEVHRVLEPGGRAAINVAGLGRRPYLPLSTYVDAIMLDLGFYPRGEIVWQKGEGASGSCAWGSWCSPTNPTLRDIHEKVLVYSKGRFSTHPSKGKGRTMEGEFFMGATLSVWKIPPASARRVGHPAPFPVELPRRLIELYTFENDLVLDPFIGAGATAVAAKQLGRHYVGYDNVQDYVDLAEKRIQEEA